MQVFHNWLINKQTISFLEKDIVLLHQVVVMFWLTQLFGLLWSTSISLWHWLKNIYVCCHSVPRCTQLEKKENLQNGYLMFIFLSS